MKRLALLVLLLVAAAAVFSLDFGLMANQTLEAENDLFTCTPGLTPWFSWNNGNGLSVFLSGLLSIRYSKYTDGNSANNGWLCIPELSRFSLGWRINREMYLEAGRIDYADVMNFAAYGFFDGARFTAVLPLGSINAGLYYTGLLYKETAKIMMTDSDKADYAAPWGFDSSAGYAASRRIFAAARWDLPLREADNLSLEFLTQFDLNGSGDRLHSQYGEAHYEFYPTNTMRIAAAALFETMQTAANSGAAFGLLAQMHMDLPGSLNDRLGFSLKFTSGPAEGNAAGNALTAYTPLSSVTQSAVLPAMFAGLFVIAADYDVRITGTLYAEGSLRYFIRAYDGQAAAADSADSGVLYGGELWTSFAWQPLEDIRVRLGTGAFFPGLGNAYPFGADPNWKVSLSITLSF